MKSSGSRNVLGFAGILCWTVFTVTLVSWWIYFGISQIGQIAASEPQAAVKLHRFQRMLFWEGLTMIASLIGAGGALLYYLKKEMREGQKLKNFFAAFTHEIKTPIAGARLKLEVLEEKLERTDSGKPFLEPLKKVFSDIDRLTLQVDNSLFLGDESVRSPIFETLSLRQAVESVGCHFPSLAVSLEEDLQIFTDGRMIEAILSNIFNNAVIHGKATAMNIVAKQSQTNLVLVFTDNGAGFAGNRRTLSIPFTRQYPGSGSGIGLYLVRTLTERLRGKISFPETAKGFSVQLEVPAHE